MRNYYLTGNSCNPYPTVFDAFDRFFAPAEREVQALKTDVKETEAGYELEMAVPGFKKEEIGVTVENGYLTVTAERKDAEGEQPKYLRREISRSISRSFYVGDYLTAESVKAKFENGLLVLSVPKEQAKPETNKTVVID